MQKQVDTRKGGNVITTVHAKIVMEINNTDEMEFYKAEILKKIAYRYKPSPPKRKKYDNPLLVTQLWMVKINLGWWWWMPKPKEATKLHNIRCQSVVIIL